MTRRTARLVAAACAVLALAMATVPLAEGAGARPVSPAPAATGAQSPPTVERSELIGPAQAIVDLRWLGGIGALVLSALLLLLYAYRRRMFILEWVIAWVLLAGALFVVSREYGNARLDGVATGFSQFLIVCSSLAVVQSIDNFRQRTRIPRAYFIGLLPLFIWFTLAPLALGTRAVLVPGYLMAAGVQATAGIGYLRTLRHTGMLGAGLIGAVFVLIAGANVWLTVSASQLSSGFSLQIFSVTAILYVFAGLGMHLMVFEDMTYELRRTNRRLEAAQGELRQLVITDALTGCFNRRHFEEIIGREIQRHRRYEIPLSLVFVDVDHFKAVNDSLGHEAGDRVLKLVARVLVEHVRQADYVFRWGGDEFLILMSCAEEEARQQSRRLGDAFAKAAADAGFPSTLGLSVGCVEMPDAATSADAIVRLADERMYLDKWRGRKGKVLTAGR